MTTVSSAGSPVSTGRPLPVRVEPRPDEQWAGYLDRVGAAYRLQRRTVLRHVLGIDLRGTARALAVERTLGIAVLESTAARFAHGLGIDPDAVNGMHLTRFHGSALHIPADARKVFDPSAVQPAGRRHSPRLGFLWSPRRKASCPDCRRERPDHWPLSWRLRWHVVCVQHLQLIDEAGALTARHEPDSNAVAAQKVILDRLAVGEENQTFFEKLGIATAAYLRAPATSPRRLADASPLELIDTLPAAVDRALNRSNREARPGPEMWRPSPSRPWTDVPVKRRIEERTPLTRRMTDAVELARLPVLLPLRWLVPELADLTFPVPIHRGRAIAGVAVHILASGGDIDGARNRPGQRQGGPIALAHLLERLEAEGRLESYWDAVRSAVTGVLREGIDYSSRRAFMYDSGVYDAGLRVIPDGDQNATVLRTWLVDQWACAHTSTYSPRLSTQTGRLEAFDRRYGQRLTDALERYVATVAG